MARSGASVKKKPKLKKESDEQVHTEDKLEVSPRDIENIKAWIKMAKAKRKARFEPLANRLRLLYKGKLKPAAWDADGDEVYYNMMFPNVEISKTSIFFRNPRIFVKSKKQQFILENNTILDGMKASKLLEDGANYVVYENNANRTIKDVRDDALILTYGVAMTGYEGETGLNEEGMEYIKEEEIFVSRVSPFKFLADPEGTDCLTFKDCRWVGRELDLRWLDFKEDDWYENKDDAKPDGTGYADKIRMGKNKPVQTILDVAGKSYADSEDAKRIRLYEIWIKPTPGERKGLTKDEPGGKVVVISMSASKAHKVIKWPNKFKNYPFRGLCFVKDNDDFYPISEVAQYVQQINEKNKIRTAQLKHVKTFGMKKVIVNSSVFDSDTELDKLEDPEAGPFIKANLGTGLDQDIRKHVMVLQFGSAPNEMFMVDRKVEEDADKISGISDLRRGIPPQGIDSATEARQVFGSGSVRFMEKKSIIGEFYQDIARMIVQLIKQHWTTETVVRRLGTLTPEWTENFTTKDIAIEDDVEIDIGEMVPTDEIMRKKYALDYLELVTKGATTPAIKQKLAEEGYELYLSEAIKEGIYALGIRNEKVIRRLDPNRYIQVLQELLMAKLKPNPQSGIGPPGGGGNGKRLITEKRGTPTVASQMSRATKGTGQPAINTAAVQSEGIS